MTAPVNMSKEGKTSRESRELLQVDLSGKLVHEGSRKEIRCIAVNATSKGIGIVCFEQVDVGSGLLLLLSDRAMTLSVVWCRSDGVREGIFHVGLQSTNPGINVKKQLEDDGLIPLPSNAPRPVRFVNVSERVNKTPSPITGQVLVIEDDPDIREYLRIELERKGLTVFEAESVIEGSEALAIHPEIQLVITDLIMPEGDGMELVSHLRESSEHKNIPIIVISGNTTVQRMEQAKKFKIEGWLTKPFSSERLLELITKNIGKNDK